MSFGGKSQYPTMSRSFTPASNDSPPKKQPDTPKIETHIGFFKSRKDGKVWVKHQIVITDWKPVLYYEKGVASAEAKALAKEVTGRRS